MFTITNILLVLIFTVLFIGLGIIISSLRTILSSLDNVQTSMRQIIIQSSNSITNGLASLIQATKRIKNK